MKRLRTALKILLPVVVLVGAMLYVKNLIASRPEAPQVARPERVELVTVSEARAVSDRVVVHAVGRVKAARETMIAPEVSGRVVEVHPQLVVGGRLDAGSVAFRVDPQDFELVERQQAAAVTRARVELQLESGRRSVAESEWQLLSGDVATTEDGKALALRKPQLELARANLQAAQSAHAQARLRLDKTAVVVPFNATVRSESVEEGLLAGPQGQLAHLIGTDAFWIEAAVPIDKLAWIDVPAVHGFAGARGARVRVVQAIGDGPPVVREGHVVRLVNELDPLGVQARVVVEVLDPLRLAADAEPGMPLLLNAFVTLEIEGRPVAGAVEVPRVALRDGNRVWVLGAEGRLEVRAADIVWRDDEHVLVRSGVAVGDRVITSRLATPVAGMKLRVAEGPQGPPQAGEGAGAAAAEAGR